MWGYVNSVHAGTSSTRRPAGASGDELVGAPAAALEERERGRSEHGVVRSDEQAGALEQDADANRLALDAARRTQERERADRAIAASRCGAQRASLATQSLVPCGGDLAPGTLDVDRLDDPAARGSIRATRPST